MPTLTLREYGLLATIAALMLGAWYLHHSGYESGLVAGKAEVQKLWDAEEAEEQNARVIAEQLSREAKHHDDLQHQKDIDAAKTKAGADAIANYLKSIGVLHQVSSVSVGDSKADSPKGVDATTSESSTSDSIKRFAEACASDAMMVLRWQDFARTNDLPIEK